MADQKTVNRLLKEAGHSWAKREASTSSRSGSTSKPKTKAQRAEDQLAGEVAELLATTVVAEVAAAAEKDKASGKVLELLIEHGEGSFEVAGILERRGVKGIRSGMSASAALKKAGLKEPALRSVALEQALRVEQDVTGSSDGLLLQSACAAYKVDPRKLEDGIRSRLKTEADAGPAGKLAKKKAAKKR